MDVAVTLDWDAITTPAWKEIAEAVRDGEFGYGMTNPAGSNSGFSTLVALASALSGTGTALTGPDVRRVAPQLREFFAAQELTSGSSGWLADAFPVGGAGGRPVQLRVGLLSLNDGRSAAEPVIHPVLPIYPADGW